MNKSILVVLIFPSALAFGQAVTVSPDSSRIIFPNNVAVEFVHKKIGKRSSYQFNDLGMRTLISQANYLHKSLQLHEERVRMLTKELELKDSAISVMKTQQMTTEKRLQLYSSRYDELKSVSTAYDQLVKSSIADLENCRKSNGRLKRKAFVKGIGAGVVIGIATGAVILLAVN